MNENLKPNERELIKVASYFKRQSKKLISEGKVGEEHKKVEETVDRFIAQMNEHAEIRRSILEQREYLNKLIKDNAQCPKCHTSNMIKLTGIEKNEKGWKSNRYKCRKCNIQFTWNRPNNPWDMIEYINEVIGQLRTRNEQQDTSDEEKSQAHAVIESMKVSLDKLTPIIEAHNKDYEALKQRDEEMERLIHEFKNTLLIEKIKMDTWENRKKTGTDT